MSDLVIRNCRVLDVPEVGECRVLAAMDVHVDDATISAVVPTASVSIRDAEVVDGTGLLATPGLTNSHTHSPMVMMRGSAEDVSVDDWFNKRVWPMEVNLTPERVRLGARLACAEMLLAGVTTFVDHYFHADQIAYAAIETGIRADLAPTFFSSEGDGGREQAFDLAREIAGLGSSRVRASLGPHSSYTVSEADLRLTAEIARSEGFRIHLHASENIDQTMSSLSRLGVTPIRVLERTGVLDAGALIAHGCGIIESDLPLLAAHGARTAVACCPKVYLKHALAPITPVRALLDAGVAVGAGTDGAAGHNTLDVWEAMRLVALVQKYQERDALWMTVSETLRLAMRGGAQAAGLGGVAGAINVGMRADLVLVDQRGAHCQPLHDPRAALVYSNRASDVDTVIVDGAVVVRGGVLQTLDVNELLAEVREVAPLLLDTRSGRAVQHYAP